MSYHDSPAIWKSLLLQGVKEDGWPWDWTSLGIQPKSASVKARIIAKSDGIWAAEGLVAALSLVAPELGTASRARELLTASSRVRTGTRFKKTQTVCEWKGIPELVLALERPFLNLAAYACGVATATRRIVELVRKACPERTPRITATRKTLPGYRDIAIHSVIAGGGYSHRVNLAGGVLVKENHIASAGSVSKAVTAARRIAPHGLKIEVEVRSERELSEALRAQADVVMLDNFSPKEVRNAVALVERSSHRPLIEVSGGLNENTIAAYAMPGVDILSLGGLTHSVRAADLSLLVT
ncbi:MAG: nicotinate-nucleotide diphosphorylase (carboxylating) [Bdellovibrionales bacterium GWB1_55_8]|nr:MAG: nicotinate-nucleotide diphosphorylase (carboxylating) [Bdellovibrionales bacterium GWB1_55_8]